MVKITMDGDWVGSEAVHDFSKRDVGYELLSWLRPFVRHCGAPTREPWHLRPRRLLDYLLHGVESGHGIFSLDGTDYEVQAGDLFWVPPGVEHELRGTSAAMSCPYVHFDLIYRPEASHWYFLIDESTDLDAHSRLRHPDVTPSGPLASLGGRIRTPANARIIHLMKDICNEAFRGQPFVGLRLSGLMFEILGELLLATQGEYTEYDESLPTMEKAVSYIRRHFAEQLRVGKIARFCGLSANHFRELFKKRYHCNPRTYIRHCRIEAAKRLMMNSEDLNLSEIGRRVGFSCVHSFSRAFYETVGIRPSQYRRFGEQAVSTEAWEHLRNPAEIEFYCDYRKARRDVRHSE